ncbi:MAG: cytochrome c biogenesis protein CcdA, partial [Deltaproteobacteria bacterium]|nr:cytochrome c biogenesis protein CcdA [Deltaproteobacteria bacterium]
PILAVLLVYIASKGIYAYGALLLFVYALGQGFLIIVAGTSMGMAKWLLESRHLQRVGSWLRKAAGVVIILVGLFYLRSSL